MSKESKFQNFVQVLKLCDEKTSKAVTMISNPEFIDFSF